jgi:hypothetical protein
VDRTRFEPLRLLGATLLLGALFLRWYSGVDVPIEFPIAHEVYVSHTAWEAFSVVDIVLAILAVACVRSRAAAVAAAVVVVWKLIDQPEYATVGPGPWLALAGAVVAATAPLIRPWMGSALLLGALFGPWYVDSVFIITRGGNDTETISSLSGGYHVTAWRAFSVLDIALAVLALAAIRSRVAAAVATAVTAAALFRVIDTPDVLDDDLMGAGAWLALAGALVALVARRRTREQVAP